jgi:hypothetical protein
MRLCVGQHASGDQPEEVPRLRRTDDPGRGHHPLDSRRRLEPKGRTLMELTIHEVMALRAYVKGDAFDVEHIDTFLDRAEAVAMEVYAAEEEDDDA